jgi:hypothetical protein
MARRTKKVTLAIAEDQIVRLDRLTIEIRATTGAIITRSEAVRAIIDAIELTELDLSSIKTQNDLHRAILNHLLHVSRE